MSDDPIACTLELAELSAQAKRWTDLRHRAEIAQVHTPRGKRIRFRAGEGVAEELEELVAVEQECCAWATWSVERIDGKVVLDVASSGDGIASLHEMFSPLRAQSG